MKALYGWWSPIILQVMLYYSMLIIKRYAIAVFFDLTNAFDTTWTYNVLF